MTTNLTPVPQWPYASHADRGLYGAILMSNLDHRINHAVAVQLRNHDVLAEYTGRDFHAVVWHADGQFHAGVHVWHIHRATISADTPQELMTAVCEAFGAE